MEDRLVIKHFDSRRARRAAVLCLERIAHLRSASPRGTTFWRHLAAQLLHAKVFSDSARCPDLPGSDLDSDAVGKDTPGVASSSELRAHVSQFPAAEAD